MSPDKSVQTVVILEQKNYESESNDVPSIYEQSPKNDILPEQNASISLLKLSEIQEFEKLKQSDSLVINSDRFR